MGFIRRAFEFLSRPTQSRTIGLLIGLILLATVSLTVYVAQQQQRLRQRAEAPQYSCTRTFWTTSVCGQGEIDSTDTFTSSTDESGCDGYGVATSCILLPTPTPTSTQSPTSAPTLIPQACTACNSDINSDNIVNSLDVSFVTDCLTKPVVQCPNADINKDGKIDREDIDCMTQEHIYLKHCKPVSPASPTTAPAAAPTAVPTSSPASTPIDPCFSHDRCSTCLNDTSNSCKWNAIVCKKSTATNVCPAGEANWSWPNCNTNQCASRAPLSPTTPPPLSSTTCPLLDKSNDYRCSIDSPGQGFKSLYKKGIASNCDLNEKCWVLFLTPAPTPTPAPAAPSLSVNLVMALNVQDPTVNDANLSTDLSLYSLETNTLVSGAPASQTFTKTAIPGKKYSANISLTNLAPANYFIIARRDNMIAKSVFPVTSASTIVKVPMTTLVFGDVNNDNDINMLDSNAFRPCYKKPAAGSCAPFNFDKKGIVDQIDYNILIQGFSIWNTQGKQL